MTLFRTFVLTAGCTLYTFAQNPTRDADDNIPGPDEVQRAIDEFNRLRQAADTNANEVTVVLEPPAAAEPRKDPGVSPDEPDSENEDLPKKAILVNGKPPVENVEIDEQTSEESTEESPVPAEENLGPRVRIQSIRKGDGKIDPETIKVRSRFPAKSLIQAPPGWQLEPDETAPAFTQDVEIQPGTFISLDIAPHVLVPAADGVESFAITEPGYEASKGYQQENTVSAVLSESIDQLDRDAVRIGNVLSDLNRLLGSLPKPQTEEE